MGKAKDNITKRVQDKFVEGVTKGLVDMGADILPTDEMSFDQKAFVLETSVGRMRITLYTTQRFLFTVYARFEDVAKARDKFNCNPNSGKYNFHAVYRNGNFNETIAQELDHFECTLPKQKA